MKGFKYKQSRADPKGLPGSAARGVRLSGGLSPSVRVSEAAAQLEVSPNQPVRRAGKSQAPFVQASTEAAALVGISVRRREVPRRSAFLGCRGERSEVALRRPIACQCVSLASLIGRQIYQLTGFSISLRKKSVAAVTKEGDEDQTAAKSEIVLGRTGGNRARHVIFRGRPRTRGPRAGPA